MANARTFCSTLADRTPGGLTHAKQLWATREAEGSLALPTVPPARRHGALAGSSRGAGRGRRGRLGWALAEEVVVVALPCMGWSEDVPASAMLLQGRWGRTGICAGLPEAHEQVEIRIQHVLSVYRTL